MSISIFYIIIIVLVTVLHSGMCFRCYVCNSNSYTQCDDRPSLVARCPYPTAGCVKLVNQMVEYKFVNSTGGEISTLAEWDGSDTNWEPIPYVKRVVTRRCGSNYARYLPKTGCSPIPLSSNNDSEEIICYCKTELCNGASKSKTNKFLSYFWIILMPLYVCQLHE